MQYLDDDGTNALEEVLCVVSSWMDIGGARVAFEQTVTPVSSTKLWKIQAAHVNVRRASAIHYRENVSYECLELCFWSVKADSREATAFPRSDFAWRPS